MQGNMNASKSVGYGMECKGVVVIVQDKFCWEGLQ